MFLFKNRSFIRASAKVLSITTDLIGVGLLIGNQWLPEKNLQYPGYPIYILSKLIAGYLYISADINQLSRSMFNAYFSSIVSESIAFIAFITSPEAAYKRSLGYLFLVLARLPYLYEAYSYVSENNLPSQINSIRDEEKNTEAKTNYHSLNSTG